jgi:hypothetical protein
MYTFDVRYTPESDRLLQRREVTRRAIRDILHRDKFGRIQSKTDMIGDHLLEGV